MHSSRLFSASGIPNQSNERMAKKTRLYHLQMGQLVRRDTVLVVVQLERMMVDGYMGLVLKLCPSPLSITEVKAIIHELSACWNNGFENAEVVLDCPSSLETSVETICAASS